MKTIQLDARQIMSSKEPVKTLGAQFGIDESDLSVLQRKLEELEDYLQVEVFHWPVKEDLWLEMGNMLEAVQQHSSTFFLIWGAADKWEKPAAAEAVNIKESQEALHA